MVLGTIRQRFLGVRYGLTGLLGTMPAADVWVRPSFRGQMRRGGGGGGGGGGGVWRDSRVY